MIKNGLKDKGSLLSIPWFIGVFVLAMIANTYLPVTRLISPYMVFLAKAGLTLTLFLIGAGLSRKVIASVGFKPLLQGVVLWILISGTALYAVMHLV